MKTFDPESLSHLYAPSSSSHKGENGRLLVIGGSQLFHASIFWSADVASKLVDLVHFTSPANENNELVRYKIKQGFWSGIVVDWGEVGDYIEEDDCVLIGPGMSRVEDAEARNSKFEIRNSDDLKAAGERDRTDLIVNYLLSEYPQKKWVVDGGALQEISVELLGRNHVITPHHREFIGLVERSGDEFLISNVEFLNNFQSTNDQMEKLVEIVSYFSKMYKGVTVLLKGQRDVVCRGGECVVVEGGNAGMTKGGTGDVLAGVVAGLFAKNDAFLAAAAGSYLTKAAGDRLYEKVGVNFSAGDLVDEVFVKI